MTAVASRIYSPSPSPFSLFHRLPRELIFVIAEFTGPSFICCDRTSKEMHVYIRECADYYATRYHTTLVPVSSSSLDSMMIEMFPNLFGKWGKEHTSLEKELNLLSAVQNNDYSLFKHVVSLGVDLETKNACRNIHGEIKSEASFPIKLATDLKNTKIVKDILAYGGEINPMIEISNRWFLDGYTDLFDYVRQGDKSELPIAILQEYIRRKDFTPFFNRWWRSDERVFDWFCDALEEIDGQVIETGYGANCSLMDCGKWCKSVHMKNGQFFCSECSTTASPPTVTSNRQSLWMESDDDTVDEWILSYGDDESIGTFDDDVSISEFYADDFDEPGFQVIGEHD